jgi:hypothetical protein
VEFLFDADEHLTILDAWYSVTAVVRSPVTFRSGPMGGLSSMELTSLLIRDALLSSNADPDNLAKLGKIGRRNVDFFTQARVLR